MTRAAAVVVAILAATAALAVPGHAQQCGAQAGGALCPPCTCCSQYGWCGTTAAYCGTGCQSQCTACSGGGGVASIVSQAMFEQMLLHRNNVGCPAHGFYTYDAFIAAANAFPSFGTTGTLETQKREIAAFLAQTSHETTGGWDAAPDGPYSWGYCYKQEIGATSDYCNAASTQWPCAWGKQYYGRGPIQLTWNYNYGPAGQAIGSDLLNNPDQVTADPSIAFKTAIWFWMTAQSPKPSCHDVITGQWTPSATDLAAVRLPGYGVTTKALMSSTVALSEAMASTPVSMTASASISATATCSASPTVTTWTATTRHPTAPEDTSLKSQLHAVHGFINYHHIYQHNKS